MPPASPERSAALRSAIERFLQERLETKLKPLPLDDPKRQALLAQFEFKTWIDDAAQRANKIQLATHILKATHPSARGTNIHRNPAKLEQHDAVGTHCLPDVYVSDAAVADAKVLDVYGFLRNIEYEGTSLLDLMLADDPDVLTALSDDVVQAQSWVAAFAAVTQAGGRPTSHTQAKQLYWLVGEDPRDDANYHLLAPLYASSLAHQVFLTINDDRFGEPAKAARQARRNGDFNETVVHEYPHLAVQKLGGSNTQNVSQLNQQRRGVNYLLASLPPLWETLELQAPLCIENAMHAFGRQREVRRLVRELAAFLKADPGKTMKTRDSRDEWRDQIVEELLQYASTLQQRLPAGWSASEDCKLLEHHCLWLDPRRADQDEDFAAKRRSTAWVEEVQKDFGHWLNDRVAKASGLVMGGVEDAHWAKELQEAIKGSDLVDV